MNHYIRKMAALALACAFVATAAGCGASQVAQTQDEQGILVTAQNPKAGTLTMETAYMGRVQPNEIISVFAKLPATVTKIYVKPGDMVKKGDLLFELDSKDVMTSVKQAQAGYRSAAAQVDQMTGSSYKSQLNGLDQAYDSAYEAYDNARDYEKATKKRYDEICLTVGASSIEAKSALADWKAAEAALDKTETYYRNARNSYNLASEDGYKELSEVAAATLNQAQVGLDAAMQQLENTKVTAPIDGVIESCSLSEQNMALTSAAAVVLSNKELLTVSFGVSSSAALQMEIGDVITVEKGQNTYRGTISEVGNMVNAQTGLFTVKAVLEAPGADLLTGISVKVIATTDKSNDAIIIPQNAVYYNSGEAYVYVVEDGTARRTPVTLGVTNADEAAVLTGLRLTDMVITSWNPNLAEGALVAVQQ